MNTNKEEIPTADEFAKNVRFIRSSMAEIMIAYAKMHRENIIDSLHEYSCDHCSDAMDEIYPETNIK